MTRPPLADRLDAGLERILAQAEALNAELEALLAEFDPPRAETPPASPQNEEEDSMAATLTSEALGVLAACTVDGCHVKLPDATAVGLPAGRLPRPLYEAVNKILELLGGKWNRKAAAHVFETSPEEEIEAVVQTGELPRQGKSRKQLFQFFETPDAVADRVIELAELTPGCSLLEPSAGRGALVRAVLRKCPHPRFMALVDLDPLNCVALSEAFPDATYGFSIREGDFLSMQPSHAYGPPDRVVMNPPFTRGQDMEHVCHAARLLKPGGILVSVMSTAFTFRMDRRSREFREWLQAMPEYHLEELPAGAFRESGTDVRTVIVKVQVP